MIERHPMIGRQPPLSRKDLFFSFHGRIKRSAWWKCQLVIWIAGFFALSVIALVALGLDGVAILALALMPFSLWCTLAVSAKRWHDRNKSGWWSLIILIPYIGAVWMLIELGCLSGTKMDNKFGPEPY